MNCLNCFSTPRTVWWLDSSRLQKYVQFGAKHDQMRQNNHIVYKGKQLFIFMKLNPSIYGANKLTKTLILYLKPLTVAHGLDMICNQYIVHYFSIGLLSLHIAYMMAAYPNSPLYQPTLSQPEVGGQYFTEIVLNCF